MPLSQTVAVIQSPRCKAAGWSTGASGLFAALRRGHFCAAVEQGGRSAAFGCGLLRIDQKLDAAPGKARYAEYGVVINDALEALGSDPRLYRAESIRTFILSRTKGRSRSNAKEVTSVTRMFLRHLIAERKCRTGLDDAVPSLAMWRLSALPRYLPAVDIERVIAACERETAVGLRDRAAILLLARLGLRAGDIVKMDLSDFDWVSASVRVSGKSRYEVKLPITQEAGDAILEYLRRGRPPVQDSRLFVRVLAPWTPLKVSSVSAIVERAIARAGVEAPFRGAHVLRHSAATEMLRQGATLEQVGTVLRHQYLDTTAHYAKVDVQRLRSIALPWPEVFHAEPTGGVPYLSFGGLLASA